MTGIKPNRSWRVPMLIGALCVVMLCSVSVSAQDTLKAVTSKASAVKNTSKAKKAIKLQHSDITPTPKSTPIQNSDAGTDGTDTAVSVIKQHSPKRAFIYSAILPGLGQTYNRQAWKIPIIYVGAGVVTYFAITNYQGKVKFETEYRNRMNGNTGDLLPNYASYPDANIYSIYQSYNRNFQLSIICGGLVYILNLIDAYVYGHLFDFEINDDISMRIAPKIDLFPYGNDFSRVATGVAFQIRF